MNRLSIAHFIIIGLLFWGLPAIIVAGPQSLLLALAAILPVWWLGSSVGHIPIAAKRYSIATCVVLVGAISIYLLADSLFGRKMLSHNMFLSRDAVSGVVDDYASHISEGRGPIQLLGTLMIFVPFAFIDAARGVPRLGRWALWIAAASSLFYETGISRGFLLMAVFSIALGATSSVSRFLSAGVLAMGGFVAASAARGDFGAVAFSNPLFDSVAFPFINLSMMLNSSCGSGQWYGFVAEFFKKLLPAFIFPKTVFSFNVEITSCIYPMFGKGIESISIFTYLGEFFYYKPAFVTAILAGALMGILAKIVDRELVKRELFTTRVFSGLMCVVLLRSRVLDVMSFMLAQLAFLLLWPTLCAITRLLRAICTPDGEREASTRPLLQARPHNV